MTRQRFAKGLFGVGLMLIVFTVIAGLLLVPLLTGKAWPNGVTSLTYFALVAVSCAPAAMGLLMLNT